MKDASSLLLVLAMVIINAPGQGARLSAQTLNDDGSTHTINANGANIYEGSAQEYTIPTTASNTISFILRGGDGGYAKAGANCQSNGGAGATTTAVFKVGDGTNELVYGGKIRFIVGKHGENDEVGGSNHTTGGGGGGTAVLYRLPTDNNWIILAAAGGGGGAHQGNFLGGCIDSQKGQGGRATENGGDGEGTNSGSGGTNGNGGSDGTSLIYSGLGGGGAYSNGNPSGGGQGYYSGGYGAQALTSGGFGFGGGGGSGVDGGGGGGGYSGGGGGGNIDNGGGGGSYVNTAYAVSSTITAGGLGAGSSQNGHVDYTFSITPIVWTGAVDDNWNNINNWSPARVPNSSDLVNINNAVNDPRIPSNVTANARVVRVFSGGELTILVDGVLNLHPLKTNGISNYGTLTNAGGDINIFRYNGYPNFNGIENYGGTFINQLAGVIKINGMDDYGIWNRSNGTFTNQSGGTINVGTASNQIGDDGIQNATGCSFTNFGTLNIRNTVYNGVDNYGSFSNASNGTIKINQTTDDGIQCSGGTFTNNGEIELGELAAIGFEGIQLSSTSSFKNNATGTLSIWQASDYGVYVDANCTFQNTGDLFIGGLGGSGIQGNAGIVVLGFFYNDPGGELFVDQTVFAGILTANTGVFSNKGTMTIGSIAATGGDGIQNQGTFNNFSTGTIIIVETGQNGIRNFDETFANAGLLKIGENGNIAHNAIYNAGDNPVFLNSSCSAAIHVFDKNILDPANSFTNSGTIVKESAGNSNIETNNGVIIYNAGSFTADNGDTPVSISGNISGRKVWTACAGNGWANAQNWYPRGVPVTTDQVVIYPLGNNPLIPSTKTGMAKYVYVEDGAGLTNNGSLSVTEGDLRILSGATVDGNGTYDLTGNFTVSGGTFNAGTSTVTMTGTAIKSIGNDPVSFYNLIIDKPSDIAVYIITEVTVTNDLTINSGDLAVYGVLSGSLTCPHLYLGSGSDLSNHGSVTLTDGALWIQPGATADGNGQYFISGSFAIEVGGAFSPGTSTVTMNGTGNTGISPAPITFYNLITNKPSDKKVIMLDVTVTNDLNVISGDLELLEGYSLTCPSLSLGYGSDLYNDGSLTLTAGDLWIQSSATVYGNGQYSLSGNFTLNSGGTFTPGTSTVALTGAATQSVSSEPVNFYNLVIDKLVSTKLNINSDVTVQNNLNLMTGEVEVLASSSLTCPSLFLPGSSKLINKGTITVVN